MTLTYPPLLSPSLYLSPTHVFTPTDVFRQHPRPPVAIRTTTIRMCYVTTRPKRTRKKNVSPSSEEKELVRSIMKNFTDKQPLMNTLNKYVRFVRTEHCFLLFEELGNNDKWLQCLEVFRWMQKQRWYIADNGVYSKLISVMGKKGQTRMAMWLFSEMRNSGCKPDSSVYNSLITAHLHSRDKSKALAKALMYFDKMKGMERCKPTVVTYNILLRAFAQARNIDQVNNLFKDLSESIVTPDIFTFNGVMDAYGKNGMIREMELVLSRMKSNQTKPDIITYNLLIDSYGRKQEFDKMEQVFKSLTHSKEKPTLPTFNSMITNYGKARLRERAEFVLQKMNDMGYKPSFITYECLIMMYGHCGSVSRAREIFDQVAESVKEKKVSTLNAMLEVYCRNALPMEADVLFESMCRTKKFQVDSSTYKLLYKAYSKADMKDLVQKLLVYMDKDGIIPNKRFFLDALGAIGSSSRSQKSAKIADGSRRQAVIPNPELDEIMGQNDERVLFSDINVEFDVHF
ncbi:pentatricopeptide repeat-containing protein At4g39620, chloroplastic-like [Primulina huaijiensis]|uniref:pentatricopeptide repeat-containing protein At4g39620, chloroplastic-like n=1 Tax=Primulina huaijiensis TaxID=1492673 RepID=UPI003CC78923